MQIYLKLNSEILRQTHQFIIKGGYMFRLYRFIIRPLLWTSLL